jgi:peptide/nickel transport system substrate-binding protein
MRLFTEFNMSPSRRLVLALAAALLPSAAIAQERVLSIVSPWEISSLEPARAGYIFSRMQITETLMEADDGGLPKPGLAASWSVSADGLTWRFILRSGAKFHDGTSVASADAVKSLERARVAPAVLANAPIASITADGDNIVITTKTPFVALPAFLAHTSTQVLAPSSFGADDTIKAIVGSGPYKVTALAPPQKLEVEAFEGWTGSKPAVRKASYLAAGRGETRALMAEGGQADLAFTLDPASFARLSTSPAVTAEAVTIPRTIQLKVNAGHPLLSDVRARQAISLAIDRTGIARAILRDPASAPTQLFPQSLTEWHNTTLAPLATDVAKAKALLADLGWKPGSGGILQRGAETFKLTLRTFPDRPELPLIAAAIQDQLKEVGIDLQVAVLNSSEIPAGHKDGTLELALLARNFSLVPDPIGTVLQDFGANGGDWGAMKWSNAEMVATLTELAKTTGAARRAELRGTVSKLVHAELPVIPVAWYRHTAAISKRISGATIDPLERSYRLTDIQWAK